MKDEEYFIFNKGDKIKLSKFFNSSEFECKCRLDSCKEQKIAKALIEKLTKVREELAAPMTITSGYRCEEHNTAIGGAKSSQHILSNAADVKSKDMDKLDELLQKEFMAIGDAKPRFLHVDLRNKSKIRWIY